MLEVTALPKWYEKHRQHWVKRRKNRTILLFFGTEVGWATMHSSLLQDGWNYVRCSIWNKGIAHIAGNINTASINQFPCVTEVCVMYIPIAHINGMLMQHWLRQEWKRAGLPLSAANVACGSKSAGSRKYLACDEQWYAPPPAMFEKMSLYANEMGDPQGRPYFNTWKASDWDENIVSFNLAHGVTNVWEFPCPTSKERVHANQKPKAMAEMLINTCSKEADVIWDCFAGSGTFGKTARSLKRHCYSAEIDPKYWTE